MSLTPEQTLVLQHLREILGGLDDFTPRVAPEAIAPEHRLYEDLGVDSVALLDLGMGLEARLGCVVDEAELAKLATVGAIARHYASEA